MSYQVPQHIDKNKIFIVKRSEIEGRLEPEFYSPSIFALEKKIRSLSSHKLSFYAKSLVGGATPLKSCSEEYYSNEKEGIPFLRVQNLQPDGNINLSNCLYINTNTHNGLLKRSQVNGGDLLVKITGVGRMAVASVAPKNFVGNTNQHMVVIKTNNESTSKYLSRYLNLDIIEKIASRHSTGGTRPALDYPSLKAIPIIENIDFSLIDNALYEKQKKEAEAQKLLDSIDGYILSELGITMPKSDLNLKERIFFCNFKQATGGRLDPKFNNQWQKLKSLQCNYPKVTLADVVFNSGQYGANETAIDYKKGDTRYIRITDIDDLGCLKENNKVTCKNIEQNYILHKNDLLFARSGSVGKCYIHKRISEPAIFAGYLIRFIINAAIINPDYLFYYCNSSLYKYWVDTIQRPAVQANINSEEFRQMIIPLPPLAKQQEIADHITALRHQAAQLQQEGKEALEKAKQEVEQMILGK